MHLKTLTSLAWIVHIAAAASFVPPFKQEDWLLSGDARITDSVVELVHEPKQKGAVWAKDAVPFRDFTLEAVIRSTADVSTSVGKSGFSIWYTSDKLAAANDVHGAPDTWDGLAVMVDSLASGDTGSVRGHLNDGSTKFSSLKDVTTESLSLCYIDYRKAAGAITVRIGYSEADGFAVDVNGQKCFISTEMLLPKGHYFGISADSDVAGDTLSIERLEITPGMKGDLAAHLPQHEDDAPKAQDNKAADKAQDKAQDNKAAKDTARDAKEDRTESKPEYALGITRDEVSRLLEPISSRVELMDVKLAQVQSSVEQLVDTISLSMSQITEAGSLKGGASTGPDSSELASLQKELQNLRTQLADWRKTAASSQGAPAVASSSPSSVWLLLTVFLPAQLVAVAVYHSWLRRKERHEKLL